MKTVKIYCLHPFCKDVESTLRYMRLESLKFNFEWSPTRPDYLIASEHVYTNKAIYKEFKKLFPLAGVVIFYAAEAMSPDFNLFDYAIGFDGNLKNGDRFVQLPPPYIMFRGFLPQQFNEISTDEEALNLLSEKKRFCNFLYSNWMAHPNRDKLFYILSSYKRVDSLGKHLNNVGTKGTGFVGHALDCIKLKSPYKFSIACENATYLGYTSEKLLTSLAAHTVPIYWGDPEIVRNINPDCFINCNGFDSLEEVIDVVKEIDEDDERWAHMVAAPWRTQEQIVYHEKRYSDYISFFENIFTQDVNYARRIPDGTFPRRARDFFRHANPVHYGRMFYVIHKLKRLIGQYN